MDTTLHHTSVLPVNVGDVHSNSGDIDSLLSVDPSDSVGTSNVNGHATNLEENKTRRLLEPYERHRAHDLRAECYRRGIRPIKKGPNANDNKNGYIVLLRKYDGTAAALHVMEDMRGAHHTSGGGGNTPHHHGEDDLQVVDHENNQMPNKKRRLPSQHLSHHHQQSPHHAQAATLAAAAAAASMGHDLSAFYDTAAHAALVPVLPLHYNAATLLSTGHNHNKQALHHANVAAAAMGSATATSTSDLEILSGIANTYTTQTAGVAAAIAAMGSSASGNHENDPHTTNTSGNNTYTTGDTHTGNVVSGNERECQRPTTTTSSSPSTTNFCGKCRTVVTDQLMESIRLGWNKMQALEMQRVMEQRNRDTTHLRDVITTLRELRASLQAAQQEETPRHELLMELEDDILFFQLLKEQTKERMRKEMQETRAAPVTKTTSSHGSTSDAECTGGGGRGEEGML